MKENESKWLWWLVLGSFLIHFANIGGFSIYALDEAKNATAAIEMMQQDEWVLPTFNREPRFAKPPLHYYAFALAYSWFGFNPFAARFFPALLGFCLIWVVYGFTRYHTNKRLAFWVAFVVCCSPHWAIQFHMAVPDAFLIFFLTCSLACFYTSIKKSEKSPKLILAAYLSLGLAVLSKGPVAIVLVAGIMGLYLLIGQKKPLRQIAALLYVPGVLLFFCVVLPWYVLVGIQSEGQWLSEFFLTHNLSRFSAPMEGHGGGPWLTWGYVFVGMLPFSPLLVFRLRKLRSLLKPANDLLLFSACAAVVIVLFFSVSATKLPNYTVPAYPFIAILVGFLINRFIRTKNETPVRVFGFVSLLTLSLLTLLPYILFRSIDELRHFTDAAFPLLVLGIICTGLLAAALLFRRKNEEIIATVGISFYLVAVTFFYFSAPALDRFNPVLNAPLQTLRQAELYYYQIFNPAFSFYLQKEVKNIEDQSSVPQSGFVLTREKYLPEFERLNIPYRVVHAQKDLFEPPVTVVLEIRP
ncbi:ArnT family glycosyltransferase [Cyclobacterium xiamenense]|uniref:ArnT family glycosyltransferase n=1 Tax=Cyclobacterium xiamenense TaxID=1297121 RepID=UPI0012B83AC3|nr:glycosyltransferase family 39 protein [Cyclobacterium xiamenense]